MRENKIRLACEADASTILGIYEYYVNKTAITFEYSPPSISDFKNRIVHISAEYPYITYLLNEKIVGYAYAHKHLERAAYQWNAELSVYVDVAYLRCGIGRTLYHVLLEILQLQNIQNVYGCVTSPNENSEKLHASFGFTPLGVFHKTGYKFGKWKDVTWFEKCIGIENQTPQPFKSIKEIDKAALAEIFHRYSNNL